MIRLPRLLEEVYAVMTNKKLKEIYPNTTRMSTQNWKKASYDYALTEEFIRDNLNFLDWYSLCKWQKLYDDMILKFLHTCYIETVAKFQRLSEQCISDNWGILKCYEDDIANYQLVSPKFREKYDLNQHINHKTNWLYWSDDEKATYIKEYTAYELQSDQQGQYILAYKGVRKDGYSKYNWQIQYKVGETYEPVNNCDCDSLELASSGLSAWYEQEALDYCDEKLLLVKIYLKDLGVIAKEDKRIRCRKLTVVEEVKL